jgi:valyl-tRNA synthetase
MGDASRRAAQATLAHVLDGAMRILHPVMPFITEAVWQRLPRAGGDPASLMIAPWPSGDPAWADDPAEARMAELQAVIGAVRNIRGEYGISPGARVPLRVTDAGDDVRGMLEDNRRALRDLARVEELTFAAADGEVGASAVLRSGTELFVPLAGVIDLDRERARLREEIGRLEGQRSATEKKLANEHFVSRAPEEVVGRERDKLTSFAEQKERLAAKLAALEGAA